MNYARPPQNIEAEQALLAACLQQPRQLYGVTHILPADFYGSNGHRLSENGEIWKAILKLSSESKPTDDPVVIMGQVSAGRVRAEYLAGLKDLEVVPAHASHYADLVRETAIRREMLTRARDMVNLVHKDETLENVLAEAERGVLSLRRGITGEVASLEDLVEDAWRGIINRKESGTDLMGLTTGLKDLDNLTYGFIPGDIFIIAGRPSMGKTALMLHSARAVAKTGKGVLIFSKDMAKNKLALRLLAQESGVDGDRLRKARLLSKDDLHAIKKTKADLSQWPIYIEDSRSSSVLEMVAQARELSTRVDLGLICLDYIQLCIGSKVYRGNKNQEITEISSTIKSAAGLDDLGCAWLVLSQLSRACEQRADKRPILSDLRESGSLEQDADIVVFIYRDVMYNPDTTQPNVADIIVSKHRDGPTGLVKTVTEMATGRFYDAVIKEMPF